MSNGNFVWSLHVICLSPPKVQGQEDEKYTEGRRGERTWTRLNSRSSDRDWKITQEFRDPRLSKSLLAVLLTYLVPTTFPSQTHNGPQTSTAWKSQPISAQGDFIPVCACDIPVSPQPKGSPRPYGHLRADGPVCSTGPLTLGPWSVNRARHIKEGSMWCSRGWGGKEHIH